MSDWLTGEQSGRVSVPAPEPPPDVTTPGQPYGPKTSEKDGYVNTEARGQKYASAGGDVSALERDGSLLWLRKWQLTIGTQSGSDALDLSDLGFTFEVSEQQVASPWLARFMIYNVGDNIISKMAKELTVIRLEAGYRKPSNQYGLVFQGPINYYRRGRQSATDTFVEVFAMANDLPLNHATVNTWLPAGHTKNDVVKACVAAMDEHGVKLGQVPDLGPEKAPRSRTIYGMVTDVLRDVAQTAGANWFIDRDQKLNILKEGEALEMSENATPVLNSKSGLIGVPVQTMDGGLEVRSLLNPMIRPGGKIKVDHKNLDEYKTVTPGLRPETERRVDFGNEMRQRDGIYNVGVVKHFGESRGNSWYTDITTESGDPNKNAPPALPT